MQGGSRSRAGQIISEGKPSRSPRDGVGYHGAVSRTYQPYLCRGISVAASRICPVTVSVTGPDLRVTLCHMRAPDWRGIFIVGQRRRGHEIIHRDAPALDTMPNRVQRSLA